MTGAEPDEGVYRYSGFAMPARSTSPLSLAGSVVLHTETAVTSPSAGYWPVTTDYCTARGHRMSVMSPPIHQLITRTEAPVPMDTISPPPGAVQPNKSELPV